MIQVKSSDELMQRTGEGDAYVYKPMNTDLYKFHRQLDNVKQQKIEAQKAKQVKDLQDKLQWNPEAVTQPFEKYQSQLVNDNIERRARILSKGYYDPNGEDEMAWDQAKYQARQNKKATEQIGKEYITTDATLSKDPLVNRDKAYRVVHTFGMDENGDALSNPSDFKLGQILPTVYSDPSVVNTEAMYKSFANDLATQSMSYEKAFSDGDIATMELLKEVGKAMMPIKNEKGDIVGFKKGANGLPELDIDDRMAGRFYGKYQNSETSKQRTKDDFDQYIASTKKNPADYTINDYIADNLTPYVPTSTSRKRDYEDKASVKSDDKTYRDSGGVFSSTQRTMPMNYRAKTKQWNAQGKQLADGEPTTQYGMGVDFHPISIKNKPIVIKVANNQTIYDGETDSAQDAQNLGLQDLIVAGTVRFPVDKKTGSIYYSVPGLKREQSEEERTEILENYVAKHPNVVLKPFLTGGTSDASNTFGDETANPSGVSRRDRETVKKEVKVFYIPYENIKEQVLTTAGAKDGGKFAKHLESSISVRNIEAKRKTYEAEQAKAVKPTTSKPAAPKQAAPVGNKVAPSGFINVTFNGNKGQIPANKWEEFKKRHPNGTRE